MTFAGDWALKKNYLSIINQLRPFFNVGNAVPFSSCRSVFLFISAVIHNVFVMDITLHGLPEENSL